MTAELDDAVASMEGVTALPRDNGELVFAAPWEARSFAMAVALVESQGLEWDAFRHRLMAAIADDPDRPYFESWSAALEDLALSLGVTSADIDAATPDARAPL